MSEEIELAGRRGRVVVSAWPNADARYVVLIAHGYGEHVGRYEHVAQHLVQHGAAVYGPDHLGHGRSEGERASVADIEDIVADLHDVAARASEDHPGIPVVLIGHSMGGIIAARYAQQHGGELAALVLSGPAIGGNPGFEMLLSMDPIPEIPIDPETLSRDPAVGAAYAADELVYHGAFKRETLEAMFASIGAIAAGPRFEMPTLWIHGEEDALAPLEVTRAAFGKVAGDDAEFRVYDGARHEIFNETNQDEVLGDVTAFVDRSLAPR
jgi:alpha-beta hydrolase superfamily lysophospholipase